MKAISLLDVAHIMRIQEKIFQRVSGSVFQLALTSALVLAGIYLYLVPTIITVSLALLISFLDITMAYSIFSRILVGKGYPRSPSLAADRQLALSGRF